MSKCSICDSGRPRQHNPKLCSDCQDWDDLQHVASCLTKQGKFEPLNPIAFCYKHNPWWPPAQKNNYSDPRDLRFRELHDFSKSGECILCAAVRDALQAHETAEMKAKIAVWKPFVYDPCDDHRRTSEETAIQSGMLPTWQKVVLAVVVATSSRVEEEDWTFAPRILQLHLRYEQWCHGLSAMSLWQRKTMNYQQVKGWLSRCVQDHGPDCNALKTPKDMTLPSTFRLVDTHDWCVVGMAEPGDYVALSYVWALASDSADKQKLQLQRDNVQAMERPGGLNRDMLPEVVVDAIQLCAELGQRYLWIDRLCIVQDDPETKVEQLDAMGIIYHRAFLTIVALGDGVTRGLPGVSSRPRPDSYVNLSWDLLATMRNPMGDARVPWVEEAVQESKWNDRAWTFQERYLSRRRLFFDEGQVYGNCCHERWSDNTDGYQEEKWMKTAYWQGEGLGDSFTGDLQDSLEAYTGPLQQYTPRSLTFQEDILNAFAGVGSILRSRLGTELLCGHPEKFFLESLLWIPSDDGGRRPRNAPSVPSWSWASCMDGVEWAKDWIMGDDTYLTATSGARAAIVDFYVSDPKSGLRRVVHRDLPLDPLRKQCRSQALMVAKNTDSEEGEDRSADIPDDAVDDLATQCVEAAVRHGWAPSNEHLLPRASSLTDLSEAERMGTALRVLQEHETAYWWPPLTTDKPEERAALARPSAHACALAAGLPHALVFNTSVSRLRVKPFGVSWFVIPPRRGRTGCHITTCDGKQHVGVTMRMSPWLANHIGSGCGCGCGCGSDEPGKEYAVLVVGAGTATRELRKTIEPAGSGKLREWQEWVLLVMIADEDDQGVLRRVAVGAVYPDVWVKTNPEWRTVVVR